MSSLCSVGAHQWGIPKVMPGAHRCTYTIWTCDGCGARLLFSFPDMKFNYYPITTASATN